VVVDRIFPLFACRDVAIVPSLNDPLPLQQFQVLGQFVTQGFVFVSVREKDFHEVWGSWRNGYVDRDSSILIHFTNRFIQL
jgi:hypothetical protein